MVTWYLKQIGKVKKQCCMSWLKIRKIIILKCVLSILNNNKEPFLDRIVTCDKKWILCGNQQWPAQWLDWELQSASQSQTWTQKGHGHLLVICCLSDPLQLSESQWNHYIWEKCSANWWDVLETAMWSAGISQQKRPNSSAWQFLTGSCTAKASEVEWIGLQSFGSWAIFPWPLTNWHTSLSISTFCRENASTTSRSSKCFPRVCWISKHRFLHYRNKLTYFSLAKNVMSNGSYFD